MQSIQSFYDNLETYIRGLKSLGQSQDSYGQFAGSARNKKHILVVMGAVIGQLIPSEKL